MKYVALLRGINVGGNNTIKMSDLKKAFEELSLENVSTYINSGNVLFKSSDKPKEIINAIEKIISKKFNLNIKIVLRSYGQLKNTIDNVPSDWNKKRDLRCYIAFVREPILPTAVLTEVKLKEGIDFIKEGRGVVYMTTKLSGLTKSGFTKLVGTKVYKDITIRNYNTATKLLDIMEQK